MAKGPIMLVAEIFVSIFAISCCSLATLSSKLLAPIWHVDASFRAGAAGRPSPNPSQPCPPVPTSRSVSGTNRALLVLSHPPGCCGHYPVRTAHLEAGVHGLGWGPQECEQRTRPCPRPGSASQTVPAREKEEAPGTGTSSELKPAQAPVRALRPAVGAVWELRPLPGGLCPLRLPAHWRPGPEPM